MAQPSTLSELANGAEVAVTISIVTDEFDADITPERFNALWTMAKIAGTELPKTRRTMLLAEMESSKNKEQPSVFLSNLSATFEVCVKNLKGQQMYINAWRDLGKSGLLKFPNE